MLELTITAGGGQLLRKLELAGDRPVVIGRSRECDIRIGHPMVSREHAELRRFDDGSWVLQDLGSTHGCLVGGDRVDRVPIVSGLTVRVGPAQLSFENLADRIARELNESMADEDEITVEVVSRLGRRPSIGMDDTIA